MDNIQFWIWLIVIIVTFLARAKKKKPEGDPTTLGGEPVDGRTNPADKPISFEDLLREIQASKVPQPIPVTQKKQEYVDYDDELEEEAVTERVDYSKRDRDSTFQTYERAKQDAFNRASLEETMKIEDTVVRFGQFKGYQQDTEVNVLAEYVKDLQDPNGFRKAFILSEVLNRKF
ncbi:MAG: hypothetical protein IM631_18215 [Cytophagales bacterium]|nr:hypothetical protein [Cytophagales bacterium]MCA6373305.1 hypothetical protein [Cytophagales bacterium]MCA6377704.1 hypothetical protein [Cytophagales bacterium]MCA6385736.1 hypothetical protein [Cytophagales bacterium]